MLVTCDSNMQLDTSYLELMLSQAVADKEGVNICLLSLSLSNERRG